MYKIVWLLVFILGCVSSASAKMTNSGVFNFSHSQSFTEIENLETGELIGSHAVFDHALTNLGKATFDRCVMHKMVVSSGTLIVSQSIFADSLMIKSGTATLTSCELQDIFIYDSEEAGENPIQVTLNGGTVVKGSIYFQTGQGTIFKGPDAVIHGEVQGGGVVDLED